MNVLKQPMVVIVLIAVVAVVVAWVGDRYKLAWVSDWLAPILMLGFFVVMSILTRVPPRGVGAGRRRTAWYVKTAGFAGLVWLYGSIDIVGETPLTMRLMGVSWTMSPYAAARFLQLAGLVVGVIAVWLTMKDERASVGGAVAGAGGCGTGVAACLRVWGMVRARRRAD